MRAVVQRVGPAAVVVDGQTVGAIDSGLLIYLGCLHGDGEVQVERLADKLARLRIFEDAEGKTNLDLRQAGGAVLVVSQFTLAAETRKGNRPSFTAALEPGRARELCELFQQHLVNKGFTVETGRFGASMQVSSVNLGPATYLLEEAPPPDPT